MHNVLPSFFLSFFFLSCGNPLDKNAQNNSPSTPLPTVELNYASCYRIDTLHGFQRILLKNPYDEYSTIKTYVLVPRGYSYKPKRDEEVIYTPVKTFGIFSTSFIGMLEALDAISTITIIENTDFIYTTSVLENVKNEHTLTIGELPTINLEKLILNQPEVLVLSGLDASVPEVLEKGKSAGIKIIHSFDWQEQHPLARSEWIKFFGALLDKEKKADSIFNAIESKYLSLMELAQKDTIHPTVFFSSMYEGTWYFPGGKSYVSQLVKDANATHPWIKDDHTGSLPLSFEAIALQSSNASIWLNPDANSKDELLARDSRYMELIKTMELGIFQYDKRKIPSGGNDYWENGALRADWVLQDYIKMLHPNLLPNDSLIFFRPL